MSSILHDIDLPNCSLRKLKKLRKIIKNKPASFFTIPKSDYAKSEIKFLDKLIEEKKADRHLEIAFELNQRLLATQKKKEQKDG